MVRGENWSESHNWICVKELGSDSGADSLQVRGWLAVPPHRVSPGRPIPTSCLLTDWHMGTLRLCYLQEILPTKIRKKKAETTVLFASLCEGPRRRCTKKKPAHMSFSPHPLSLLRICSRRITCKLTMRVCACQVVQSCPTLCDPVGL